MKIHLLLLANLLVIFLMASPIYAQTKEHELERQAKQGDSDAQYKLAEYYNWHKGSSHSPQKAIYWYKKAAENGNLYACNTLGKIYENGDQLQNLGKLNDSTISVRGVRYPGVVEDMKQAVLYYEVAALSDNFAETQYHLSEIFYEGYEDIAKDYDKAFIYLKRVVNNSNLDEMKRGVAMNRLANCYRYGRGTTQDLDLSEYWRLQAAEFGYKDAQDITGIGVYGTLYLEDGSEYIPTSSLEFVTWHKKSEENNDTIHSQVLFLSKNGSFTIPAEYTGEHLVMNVNNFLPVEFIGAPGLKLKLIKEQ